MLEPLLLDDTREMKCQRSVDIRGRVIINATITVAIAASLAPSMA
jgi:hypothetical protein